MAQWPNRTLGRRRRPHSQALKPYRGPIQGPKPTHSNGRAEKRPSVFSPMLGAHLPLRANPGSPARSLPVVPPLPSAAGNSGAPPCAVSPISTPSGTLPVGIARRYTPFALEYGHFPLASGPNRRRDCHGLQDRLTHAAYSSAPIYTRTVGPRVFPGPSRCGSRSHPRAKCTSAAFLTACPHRCDSFRPPLAYRNRQWLNAAAP